MTNPPNKGSLLVIFLTVFIDLVGFGMVIPLLPLYARQFAAENSRVSLDLVLAVLMASFSAMQFLFAPLWGRVSDRVGRRPVLLLGLFASVGFYALFGVATVTKSLTLLFIARIGAGIAGATISTAQAYIADITTIENRSKGMALIGAAFGLGFTFGPLFGFLAVPSGKGDPGPWPGYAAAILSLIAAALCWRLLPESRPRGASLANGEATGESGWSLFSARKWAQTFENPSVAALVFALFVCVFAFANFETTLSLLIKKPEGSRAQTANWVPPFDFSYGQVCLTYAYVGVTLCVAQGLLVRRLAKFVPEPLMATMGGLLEIAGFGAMVAAILSRSVGGLFAALTVVVAGFSLMMPSINALISRRCHPDRQGAVLGMAQSASALARILGPLAGIPLLMRSVPLPYVVAAVMMAVGLTTLFFAVRAGKDYVAK